jgi:N-sulfoglucosamine sulfohydrolase
MRRQLTTAYVILIVLSHLGFAAQQRIRQAQDRPNIILFVSDDHGIDALGCYGNPVVKTPNMDQLAAEGIRFIRAYCTSASCAASRAVILTGMYGHATGSYGHVHDYHHFSIHVLPHARSA